MNFWLNLIKTEAACLKMKEYFRGLVFKTPDIHVMMAGRGLEDLPPYEKACYDVMLKLGSFYNEFPELDHVRYGYDITGKSFAIRGVGCVIHLVLNDGPSGFYVSNVVLNVLFK